MKPYVIFIKDDDSLKLSKEELKNMLEDAYEHGYSEGYNAGKSITISTPSYPYPIGVPTWTDKTPITTCGSGDLIWDSNSTNTIASNYYDVVRKTMVNPII